MTEQVLNTASVAEAVLSRRSIRQYTDQPVSQSDLETIISLTGRAPSAWNLQPWRIVAVRNPEVKEQLKAAAYGQGQVTSAPVVLVVYSDMADTLATIDEVIHPDVQGEQRTNSINGILGAFAKQSETERETWAAGQTYIAVGYLSLVARSLGYDTSLMLGFNPDEVKRILNLPEHVRIPAMVSLGVAAESGYESHRHPVARITTFVE